MIIPHCPPDVSGQALRWGTLLNKQIFYQKGIDFKTLPHGFCPEVFIQAVGSMNRAHATVYAESPSGIEYRAMLLVSDQSAPCRA